MNRPNYHLLFFKVYGSLCLLSCESKQGRNAPSMADQCYTCNKFFIERKSSERYLNSCSDMPVVVHKYENQSIQTFFDSVKFRGNLPFAICFDLETTCSKKNKQFWRRHNHVPCFISFCGCISSEPQFRKNICCEEVSPHIWTIKQCRVPFEWNDSLFWSYNRATTKELCSSIFQKNGKVLAKWNVFLGAKICNWLT